MSDLDLRDQRVLIREDLNVPIDDHGQITSTQRLDAALPTIKAARDAGARVLVLSHLGRPKEGQFDAESVAGARRGLAARTARYAGAAGGAIISTASRSLPGKWCCWKTAA